MEASAARQAARRPVDPLAAVLGVMMSALSAAQGAASEGVRSGVEAAWRREWQSQRQQRARLLSRRVNPSITPRTGFDMSGSHPGHSRWDAFRTIGSALKLRNRGIGSAFAKGSG